MSLPGSYASSQSISTGSDASGPSAELIYKTPQNVLHALNNGVDPNIVYGRSTINIQRKVGQRDTRRGWFGPKQSKSTYKNYIRKTLAIERTPGEIITRIRELLRQPKRSATAIYNEFNVWRKVINRVGVDSQILMGIDKISVPGWFSTSDDYIANIIIQMNRYNTNNPLWSPDVKVAPRKGAMGVRGLKAPAVIPDLFDPRIVTPIYEPPPPPQQPFSMGLPPGAALPQIAINTTGAGGSGMASLVGKGIYNGGARPTRKTTASHRMARKHRHTARCGHRRQHGGATPMPLAYYQPGAYETRTLEPTGVGLAGTTSTWVREPVAQTGGSRQAGGFSPSVMGQFADAGLRFALPVVGYMGYKMFNKKSRKGRRKAGRRTRRR